MEINYASRYSWTYVLVFAVRSGIYKGVSHSK